MNSAYKKMVELEARRDRFSSLLARVVGWAFLGACAVVAAVVWYGFAVIVLSLGA